MTPNDFPYITAVHVNDCFAYQNFDINLPPLNGKPFSHLILTGKNGSGKTTILRGIEQHIGVGLFGNSGQSDSRGYGDDKYLTYYVKALQDVNRFTEAKQWKIKQNWFNSLNLIMSDGKELSQYTGKSIFSFFVANRQVAPKEVKTPTPETEFSDLLTKELATEYFTQNFKQYLVNKKVVQAFAQIDKKMDEVRLTEQFFEIFIVILKRFFEDDALTLVFANRNYDFNIVLGDGRKINFNQLSDGFSSFIYVLADLLIRKDLIRSAIGDYDFEPCGIVLLDEPEGHLHIKAQYDVLPILTEFFPNVQFIVATHSPAVISSIKNTTVFDITRKTTVTDEIVGSSFSELMVTQFGLDNEFSPIADDIIHKVGQAVKETNGDKQALKQKMQKILRGNERYLSPVLRLELESLIIENS